MKVGVFVDVSNISMNGGHQMRYDVLHQFARRGNSEAIRLNAYLGFDKQRAEVDPAYRDGQRKFHAILRDFGYKVILKETKWYTDDSGNKVGKSNVDLDMAVDALLQSDSLDRVLLVTGDGDFVKVVNALQNKGCKVEAIAFDNVSAALREEVDVYTSGYLVPRLLSFAAEREYPSNWGEVGSLARGVVIYNNQEKKHLFLRYLKDIDAKLWITDSRDPLSPYATIYCGYSDIDPNYDINALDSRNAIFEFTISQAPGKGDNRLRATNARVIRAKT